MKEVDLQNFLLLGKKAILIARFSETEFYLARKNYGAQVVETPETAHLAQLCFTNPHRFFVN